MIFSLVILQLAGMLHGLNIADSTQLVMANVAHLLIPASTIPALKRLTDDALVTTNYVAEGAFGIGLGIGVIMRMISGGNERRIAVSNAALAAALFGLLLFVARFAIESYVNGLFK